MSTEDEYDLSSIQSILGISSGSAVSVARSPQPSSQPASFEEDAVETVPEGHNNLMAFLKTRRDSAASSFTIGGGEQVNVETAVSSKSHPPNEEPSSTRAELENDDSSEGTDDDEEEEPVQAATAYPSPQLQVEVSSEVGYENESPSVMLEGTDKTAAPPLAAATSKNTKIATPNKAVDQGEEEAAAVALREVQEARAEYKRAASVARALADAERAADAEREAVAMEVKRAAVAAREAGEKEEAEAAEASERPSPSKRGVATAGGTERDAGSYSSSEEEEELSKRMARLVANDDDDDDDENRNSEDDEVYRSRGGEHKRGGGSGNGGGGVAGASLSSSSPLPSSRLEQRVAKRGDEERHARNGTSHSRSSLSRSRGSGDGSGGGGGGGGGDSGRHFLQGDTTADSGSSPSLHQPQLGQQEQRQHQHQQQHQPRQPLQLVDTSNDPTESTRDLQLLSSTVSPSALERVPCLVVDCPLAGRLLFRCSMSVLLATDDSGSGSCGGGGLLRISQDPPTSDSAALGSSPTKGTKKGGKRGKKAAAAKPPYVNGRLVNSAGPTLSFGELLVHRFAKSRVRALQRGGGSFGAGSAGGMGGVPMMAGNRDNGLLVPSAGAGTAAAASSTTTVWRGSAGTLLPLDSVRGASLRQFSVQSERPEVGRLGGGATVFGRHLAGVACFLVAACVAVGTVGDDKNESSAAGALLVAFTLAAFTALAVCFPLVWHHRDRLAMKAALHSMGGIDGVLDSMSHNGASGGGGGGSGPHPALQFTSGLTRVRPLPDALPWFSVSARRFEVLHAQALASALLAASSLLVCVVASASASPGPGLVAFVGLLCFGLHALECLRKGYLHLSSLGLADGDDNQDDGDDEELGTTGGWPASFFRAYLRPAVSPVQFMKDLSSVRAATSVVEPPSEAAAHLDSGGFLEGCPAIGCCSGWMRGDDMARGTRRMRERVVTKFQVLTIALDQPGQRIVCLLDGHGEGGGGGEGDDSNGDVELGVEGADVRALVSFLLHRKL